MNEYSLMKINEWIYCKFIHIHRKLIHSWQLYNNDDDDNCKNMSNSLHVY